MAIVTLCVIGLGWLLGFIGGILFLVAAFRESVLWGVAVLFIPFAGMVFLFKYWDEAKRAILLQVLGFLVAVAGMTLGAKTGKAKMGGMAAMMDAKLPGLDATELEAMMTETSLTPEKPPGKVGAPVDAESSFVGRALLDIRNELGPPKGTITARGTTTVFYAGLELVSDDGETVCAQRIVAD